MAGVRQFDEAAALDKALALFWEKGFAQTSMQELAAITGVQRGSLYNAYQGKEAFFLRVFDLYRDRFLAQMRSALDQPSLRDAIDNFFDCVIDSMTAGTPTRGCLSSKTALGGDPIEAPIRAALQGLLDGIEALVGARLARPEEDTGLAIPPQEAARLILTFTRGLVVLERVYQDKQRLRATADMFIGLLFGAVPRQRPRAA